MKQGSVRQRKRPDICGFEPGFNFDPKWARYDKMELSLELGSITADESAHIHQAFVYMGRDSLYLGNDGSLATPRLKIKKNSDWLFSGVINIRRETNTRYKIIAHLNINISRYFAHNPPTRPKRRGQSMIRAYAPAGLAAAREALDGNDNLVIDSRLAEARDTNWNALLRQVITEAANAIQNEMYIHCRDLDYSFHKSPKEWSVKAAEIFWEFQVKDAPLVVEEFGKHSASVFRKHSIKDIYEVEIEGSRKSFVFNTGHNSVKLALYAKTENRMRIECRFVNYPKRIYNKDINDTTYPVAHLTGLARMMSELVLKAQEKAEVLLKPKKTFNPDRVLALSDLLSALAGLSRSASDDVITATRVIRNLKLTGRLVDGLDDGYNKTLNKMAQRGLLQAYPKRKGQPKEYAPVGALKRLLEHFK